MTSETRAIKVKTEKLIAEVNAYDRMLQHLPKTAVSVDDCNKYRTSDNYLCDATRRIHTYIRDGKLHSFGVKLVADKDYGINDNSKFRQRCCNCPVNPAPPSQKLIHRAKYQSYIRLWRQRAKEWISKGCGEVSYNNSTVIRKNTATIVGVKRLS